jgi:hypothetical protein
MDFPTDVVCFVEQRFDIKHADRIFAALKSKELSTPRVMRSILFLANGSMTLFEYFVKMALADVRDLLLQAEYETEVTEQPMLLRNMSLPFTDEENLGAGCLKTAKAKPLKPLRAPRRITCHHPQLANRHFVLGETFYTVMANQPEQHHVFCSRQTSSSSTIVRLPLEFVADQLAEKIDLTPVGHF